MAMTNGENKYYNGIIYKPQILEFFHKCFALELDWSLKYKAKPWFISYLIRKELDIFITCNGKCKIKENQNDNDNTQNSISASFILLRSRYFVVIGEKFSLKLHYSLQMHFEHTNLWIIGRSLNNNFDPMLKLRIRKFHKENIYTPLTSWNSNCTIENWLLL